MRAALQNNNIPRRSIPKCRYLNVTPISKSIKIKNTTLDPLVPYANSTGVWTDTDEDGIPDVVEAMLSNTSYWRFLVVEYPLLWAQYSWAANYYDTIKKKENESAAKEWLHDQFNPLIVDRTPPIITKFELTWIIVTDSNFPYVHLYAHVHVSVRDVGRIGYVNVTDKNNGDVWSHWNDATFFDGQHNFSASLLNSTVGSVLVNLSANDSADNWLYAEQELKGAVKQALEALSALWSQFWATLQKVGEAVARAVSVFISLLEWLIDKMTDMFSQLITQIYGNYLQNIASIIVECMGLGTTKKVMVRDENNDYAWLIAFTATMILSFILTSGIVARFIALDTTLLGLEASFTFITEGVGGFVKSVAANFIRKSIKTIIESLAGAAVGGMVSLWLGTTLEGSGSEIMRKLGDTLKLPSELTTAAIAALYSMSTFVSGLYSKKLILFYVALVASTIGLTFTALEDLLPPMSPQGKVWVDAILLIVNAIGFSALIIALKDKWTGWRDIVDGMVTILEIMASIGSMIALGVYLSRDISEAQGGD